MRYGCGEARRMAISRRLLSWPGVMKKSSLQRAMWYSSERCWAVKSGGSEADIS